jgi:hypothetical protein
MAVITTDLAHEQRSRQVENALASVRMEGLEPSPEAVALFQRYIDDELTSDQLDQAFDAFFDCKYGPVRKPGNERS